MAPTRQPLSAEELREHVQRILKLSNDLLSVTSAEGYFLWLNDRWSEVLGWSLDELYQVPVTDLIHPDDLDRTVRALEEFGEFGEGVGFRNRYRHKNGGWRLLDWSFTGREGLFYSITRDVTDEAEQTLRTLEDNRLLLMAEETAGVGHWHLDLVAQELRWSEEVYRIHGLDPAEFEPRLETAIEVYHPDDRATVTELVERAIEERGSYEFELRIVRPTGEVRDVSSIGRCLTDDAGEPVALFGVFRDITEEKHMLARVAQSDRMASLGTMAAGVAHEINNPLTWVVGTAELLNERVAELPEAQRSDLLPLVENVLKGSERVSEIVRGLKRFSHPDTGRLESLSVRDCLNEAISIAQNEIRHRAHLDLQLSDTGVVLARPTDLVQVFTNLLVNAAQAIPVGEAKDHTIVVRLFEDEADSVIVEIVDDGEGMDDAVLARVFEPFFTTKSVQVGTGLGLSICHSLITSLSGDIEVDSAPERGTSVRVRLPLATGLEAPEEQATDTTPAPRTTPTVLVIDDEPNVLSVVALALKGAEVTTAGEGHEAIRLLEGGLRPDVILCDLMMPSMTGRDVHRVVSERWPDLARRVVFATGGTFTADMADWLDNVGNPVLAKPFSLLELRTQVGLVEPPA